MVMVKTPPLLSEPSRVERQLRPKPIFFALLVVLLLARPPHFGCGFPSSPVAHRRRHRVVGVGQRHGLYPADFLIIRLVVISISRSFRLGRP